MNKSEVISGVIMSKNLNLNLSLSLSLNLKLKLLVVRAMMGN